MFKFFENTFLFRFLIPSLRPNFWGALASAAAGLGQGLFNGYQQKKQYDWQKKVDKFNMNMAQEAFDWQKHAYLNTSKDMSQAGINPAALGSGVSSNSVNAQSTSSSVTGAPQLDVSSAIQASAQLDLDKKNTEIASKSQQSTSELQHSQTLKNNQEVLNSIEEEKRNVEREKREKSRFESDTEQHEYEKSLRDQQKSLLEQQTALLASQSKNQTAQANQTEYETKYWKDAGASPNSNDKFKLVQESLAKANRIGNKIKDWLNKNKQATQDDRDGFDYINTEEGAERLQTYLDQAYRQGMSGEQAERWAFNQVKGFMKGKRASGQ